MLYKIRTLILVVLFTNAITACATFYPETKKEHSKIATTSDDCQLITKKFELKHKTHKGSCSAKNPAELLLCAGIASLYTATTAVISGSIVLAGNTVHWLEKQGKCKPDELSAQVNEHTKSLEVQGDSISEQETTTSNLP